MKRAEEVLRENVVGSTLSGQGGVTVVAQDGSIIATASALHSEQGAIALQAKQDVTLNTATERESALSEERSQKKGFLKKAAATVWRMTPPHARKVACSAATASASAPATI